MLLGRALLQVLVGQDEDRQSGVAPAVLAAVERAAQHGPQRSIHRPRCFTAGAPPGHRRLSPPRAAVTKSQQPPPRALVIEQAVELTLRIVADHVGVRGRSPAGARCSTSREGFRRRHIGWHGGVGAPGHDDPHARRRLSRQQRRDAVPVRAAGDVPVLIQPVHQQYQPLALLSGRGGGVGQRLQEPGLPVRLGQRIWHRLSGQVSELVQHRLQRTRCGRPARRSGQ